MRAYATETRSLLIVDMVQSIIHCSEELMSFVILGSKVLKLEVRFLRNLCANVPGTCCRIELREALSSESSGK